MTSLGRGRRTPDWQVQAVFDPDGEGHEFAYTIGLHDRGLPELHIWGRPSLGDDPGADWMFSPRDRGGILNEAAWKLIDGDLRVGDTWDEEYDEGLVTVRFRLDPPGDRDELEALGIAPDAQVLPVRWSLHRPPIGRPRPLTKRALARARSDYAALLGDLSVVGDEVVVPPGWELPASFEPCGEFGPLTPMVAGRVVQLWSADAITMSNLMWAAITAEAGGCLTWPVTVASGVARGVGRVEEVDRAGDAARAVVLARTEQPDWPIRLPELAAAMEFEPGAVTDEQLHAAAVRVLSDLLWTVLTTEVVADRLTPAQLLHGRGAWLTGLGPVGDLPGRQWRAPQPVLERLLGVLQPLQVTELLTISLRHRVGEEEDYRAVADRVQGWAVVSAAGCPWRGALDRLPGCRSLGHVDDLQEWATVMTSAATHLDRLSARDLAALTAPYLDVVPGLPTAIRG